MKKVDTPPEKSAGLQFIEAAARAMPKTIGDRERISAMNTIMCRIALTRPPVLVAVDQAIAFDLTRLLSPLFFFTIYLS